MKLHSTRIAQAAMALGMLARVVWAIFGPNAVFADALGYRAVAHAEGLGDAYWMPGWPLWMSLVYRVGGDGAVIASNIFLSAITIAASWFLARALFDEAIAWRAAAITSLVPSLILLPRLLLSENLGIPLFVIATIFLVRRKWIAFALATAAATYVRESSAALLVAGVFVALKYERSHVMRASAIMAVTFAIAMAPWVLRNRAVTGHATLTTSSGPNLCIGLGEGATGGYRKLEPSIHQEEGLQCAREGLAHHPFEIISLAPAKLSRLVVWDDWIVDDFLVQTGVAGTMLMRVLCNIFWWGIAAFSVVCLVKSRNARILLAPIAAVALSVIVTFGVGRFHAPLIPLLAVLASGYRRRS